MKGYQPCRAASRSSFLPTSRARFSAEGRRRDSSSVPDRTWRSTRSAIGSSEILNSVSVVITRSIPFRGAGQVSSPARRPSRSASDRTGLRRGMAWEASFVEVVDDGVLPCRGARGCCRDAWWRQPPTRPSQRS